MTTRFYLHPNMFAAAERVLCETDAFLVSGFIYDSGVRGLRIANRRGEIVALPYQGQQVWSARFDGRDLAMRSMFEEPAATRNFLETYGGFFLHCGLTGMGAPGPEDHHPLHGELPNAPFRNAWIEFDDDGARATLGGSFEYAVAFSTHYRAEARISLSADAAVFDIHLDARNLKKTPMDLMYLGHANFRPIDGARLVYAADYGPETVRVRRSIPAHIRPPEGYAGFIERLAADPTLHHALAPGLAFDPEVVFSIDMKADDAGWTHAMQLSPDGTADYVSYQPALTPETVRWICRTPDQDAIGIAFPSTSGVEGYAAEKRRGRVATLPGGGVWSSHLRLGALTADEAQAMARRIDALCGRG